MAQPDPLTDLAPPARRVLAAARRWMALLALPVLGLLAVLTTLQYRQGMQEAQRDLVHLAGRHAQDVRQLVQPAIDHVHDLRALLQAHWAAPPDAGPSLRQALQPRQAAGRPDGWSLDQASPALRERWGQVWWSTADGRPAPDAWLHRAAGFVAQARAAHARAPGFEATWFAGTDTNTAFGYPWLPTDSITRSMGTASLQAIAALRDEATAATRQWMAAHPGQTTFWSPPAISQLHRQLVVSHGALVLIDGAYRGEVSVDFRLDALQQRVAAWAREAGLPGLRLWVVDQAGQVVADAGQAWPGAAAHAAVNTPLDSALAGRLPAGLNAQATAQALLQPGRLWQPPGWLLVADRQAGAPWSVLMAVPAAPLQAQVWWQLLPNALIGLALLLMFGVAQWLLARHFIEPAVRALAYGRALARDPQAPAPRLGARWRQWVDATTEIFGTQRALLQRELANRQQHQSFNAAIVDHALAAIVSTDAQGRILAYNPAAERLFGHSRSQALGQVAWALLLPARLHQPTGLGFAELVHRPPSTPTAQRLQLQALHADGHEFPLALVGWRSEIEGQAHFTAWLVDLTERLQARDQIERQREALRQSEKLGAMGRLLAGVAHELNNPLAIVMGRAAMLEERHPQASVKADARRIREAAERCGRIVHTFLNMARARPAQRGPVALNDLVRAAADLLAYTWRSLGIRLQLQLAAGLPPAWADGDQIGPVVLNLLVNAQQALVGRPAPLRVVVSTGSDPAEGGRAARLWLRVVDNGPGVPPAAQALVFEPFFTTKPEGLGTGLGLALSRSLVREHGGELRLAPQAANGGACFCLTLPVALQVALPITPPGALQASLAGLPGASAQAAVQPQPQAGAAGPAPAARVLVVDDEPGVASLLRDMLEAAGHEVAVAGSAAEALEMLGLARFDAIVSDLRMPGGDGALLWRSVRRYHPTLARRLLFVTGDTLSPASRAFLASTGCPGLDKPFTQAVLQAAVACLLAAP